jgi:transglutaminase-like putative cysteine protease
MIRLHVGCGLQFEMPQPIPLIAMLSVHYSRAGDMETPDRLQTTPAVPVESYRDAMGNWCHRLVAPRGRFSIASSAVVRDAGLADPVDCTAIQHQLQHLPVDTLPFLLASRYCETDVLAEEAWRLFGSLPLGWARVQGVCNFVHGHITFGYEHSRATRSAVETYGERRGVCRDYAHLAVAFCRCLNIPARYCCGYVSDIGEPPPYAPMDFAAWIEVWLGNRWHTFDPRNNTPRKGRILMTTGRDAADVPLTQLFGPGVLKTFQVVTEVAS